MTSIDDPVWKPKDGHGMRSLFPDDTELTDAELRTARDAANRRNVETGNETWIRSRIAEMRKAGGPTDAHRRLAEADTVDGWITREALKRWEHR